LIPGECVIKTIPPVAENDRLSLERCADALLAASTVESPSTWPSPWREQEEDEFDRITASHGGLTHLMWTAFTSALPSFDPDWHTRELRVLMESRPGTDVPDVQDTFEQLIDAWGSDKSYGFGYLVEHRNFPPETCRWGVCSEPLYPPNEPRGKGKPRKYCSGHQKAARSHRRALQRKSVHVGKNRNLVYTFDGHQEQDLAGYRNLWGQLNTIGG
jgi:hypothetical protein